MQRATYCILQLTEKDKCKWSTPAEEHTTSPFCPEVGGGGGTHSQVRIEGTQHTHIDLQTGFGPWPERGQVTKRATEP